VGFHFVPLTALAMRAIPKEELGTATALFSLMHSMGGSVGIAMATTMFSRSMQVHHVHLSSHITIFDRAYQYWATNSAFVGRAEEYGQYVLYRLLSREASMLAFRDAFFLLSIMAIIVLPLVFLMKRVRLDHSP